MLILLFPSWRSTSMPKTVIMNLATPNWNKSKWTRGKDANTKMVSFMGPIWSNGQKSNLRARTRRTSTKARPCSTMNLARRLMPRSLSLIRLDTTKTFRVISQTIRWWELLTTIIRNRVRTKGIGSINTRTATTTITCTDRSMARRSAVWVPMATVPVERPARYRVATWTTSATLPNWPLRDAGSNSKMEDRANLRMVKLALPLGTTWTSWKNSDTIFTIGSEIATKPKIFKKSKTSRINSNWCSRPTIRLKWVSNGRIIPMATIIRRVKTHQF